MGIALADDAIERMVGRLNECAKLVTVDATKNRHTAAEFVNALVRTCEPIRAEFVNSTRDGLGVAMSREQTWVLWVARQEATWRQGR